MAEMALKSKLGFDIQASRLISFCTTSTKGLIAALFKSHRLNDSSIYMQSE